jgi:putative endonuclease
MEEHRLGLGSEFVKQYRVTRLVHVETFDDPESAVTREKRLKKWNRDWRIRLIERDNLDWQGLSHLVG